MNNRRLSDWRFSMKVVAPILAATLLVLGLTGAGILWAANKGDEASVERQRRMASHNIDSSITKLAHEVEVVAVWNDTVTYSTPAGLNTAWIDENIGVWLYKMYGHDRVYVLDAGNRPVYAMIDGREAPAERFDSIRNDVADLVAESRRRRFQPIEHAEPKSTGRAVHATGLRRVDQRPAAVSVMHIVPHADDGPAAPKGKESLLIGVRFLDGSFLDDLRTEGMMDGARFSIEENQRPGESALTLRDNTGAPIGHLIWRPEAPGAMILGHLVPLYLVMAGSVILIMTVLLLVLRKASRELQTSEAHAQHLAFHDALTGYPNRALLMERLDHALATARRDRGEGVERFALLLLDLDRFKQVNDALGHQAGDELIQMFATRLSALVRRDDVVARLGGDEFAIIQFGITTAADTEALCHRILNCAHQSFSVLGGIQANVGVSIGIAIAPDAGLDPVGLMRKADIALYRAKATGKNRHCFFADGMDESIKERRRLEADLRTALNSGDGLAVHFQPLMSSDGQTLTGLEALVRWHHPELGLLPPSVFLPVADECGLSVPIDEWVLEESCRLLRTLPNVPVSVNLSPAQFYTDNLYERVMAIVRRHGASPQRIELEITEKVLLEDNETCHGALKKLRNAGFRIALDDFGTGYSSLSYLRRFSVDKIKIDQSFIQHLDRSAESSSIVCAIINLGHAMGLAVTAEGVETPDHLRFLAKSGCDQLQGYLFSRPVPEQELVARFGRS